MGKLLVKMSVALYFFVLFNLNIVIVVKVCSKRQELDFVVYFL